MIELGSDATPEDARQLKLLNTPVGGRGSGYARYSAAMYFYQKGVLAADILEFYRICCKLDDDDPLEVARRQGVLRRSGTGAT